MAVVTLNAWNRIAIATKKPIQIEKRDLVVHIALDKYDGRCPAPLRKLKIMFHLLGPLGSDDYFPATAFSSEPILIDHKVQ